MRVNLKHGTGTGSVIRARTTELEGAMTSKVPIVPRGAKQTGYSDTGARDGMRWTATYRVVGLNGLGVDVIGDGMNEAGLSGGGLIFPLFPERGPSLDLLGSGSAIITGNVAGPVAAGPVSCRQEAGWRCATSG